MDKQYDAWKPTGKPNSGGFDDQIRLLRHFCTAGFAVFIEFPMTERHAPSSRPSRLVIVGVWLAGIAAIGGIVGMVLIAIDKVRTGRGLDTYRTHWLVEFNWIGFLVLLAAVSLALAIGSFFRYKEWREIRKLQDKYSGEHHG